MNRIWQLTTILLVLLGAAGITASPAAAGVGAAFTLTGTPNPIKVGESVNLTAAYNGGVGSVPSDMRIADPADLSTTIGSVQALTSGTAATLSVTQQLNTAGPHTFHIYSDGGVESQPFGADLIITVNKNDQTISFNAIGDQGLGTATIAVSATATSALAVSFASSTPAVCTVAGGAISFVATGTCTITASQAGNFKYNAAPDVIRSFAIGQSPNTITFPQPADTLVSAGPVALTATATSGLAVSYASAAVAICTVSGSSVTLVSVGICSVTASQAGNANYVAATPVSKSFNVTAPIAPPPADSLADQGADQNFMNDRGSVIVNTQPNQTNGDGRFNGSLFGGETGGSGQPGAGGQGFVADGRLSTGEIQTASAFGRAVSIDGQMDDGTGQFTIGTSLNQLAASTRYRQQASEKAALGFGATGLGSVKPGAYNMWAEVSATSFRNSGPGNARRGDVGIAFTGSDYLVHPGVLLGWASQYDWSRESTDNGVSSTKGFGWMSGPYMALHLTQHLTFDARAAWGRSSNQTPPLGTYTDDFKTERTLITGRLTGDWTADAWRFAPSAQIVQFQDRAEAYTNGLGVAVPGQTSSLGQLTFGPRMSYLAHRSDGTVAEPFVALKGVWTYDRSADWSDTAGLVSGSVPFTGKIEAGAKLWFPSGVTVEGFGAFDSIGDAQVSAYRGQASVRIPLN